MSEPAEDGRRKSLGKGGRKHPDCAGVCETADRVKEDILFKNALMRSFGGTGCWSNANEQRSLHRKWLFLGKVRQNL